MIFIFNTSAMEKSDNTIVSVIPNQKYLQVCFPGNASAESGPKILDMIGGPKAVLSSMRECSVDDKASLRLKLGLTNVGPSIHGLLRPTTALWVRMRIKRKKTHPHPEEMNSYEVTAAEVRGSVCAYCVFSTPSDLSYLPASDDIVLGSGTPFSVQSTDETKRVFQPSSNVLKQSKKAAQHLPDAMYNVSTIGEQGNASSDSKTELYIPPSLFFMEASENSLTWLSHILPNEGIAKRDPQYNLYLKMRFFQLNVTTFDVKIRPSIDNSTSGTERHILVGTFIVAYQSVQKTRKSRSKHKKRSISLKTQMISLFSLSPFLTFYIPQQPPSQVAWSGPQAQRLQAWISLLQKYFEIRPIWAMSSLVAMVGDNKEARIVIKHIIGSVAYRVVGSGPFSGMWVRYGFDPSTPRKKNTKSFIKEMGSITPIIFITSKDMRREIRRRFPSFGNNVNVLPTGHRRTRISSDDMRLHNIIKGHDAVGKECPDLSTEDILKEANPNTARCKMSLEAFFDNVMLSRNFLKAFIPEDLDCERVHTVIQAQAPTKYDKSYGWVLKPTRSIIRSILDDEFATYFKAKFPPLAVKDEQGLSNDESSQSSPEDSVDAASSDELSSDNESEMSNDTKINAIGGRL